MSASIRVRELSLELPYEMQGGAKAAHGLMATFAQAHRRFATVLQGIDFEAVEGDRIGIMGLNGAGKTTLLRVLNGALPPTRGSVQTTGSLQSLLSTTLGFNEHASLTENIILRGTAIGLRYRQVDAAVGSILEFSGLSDKANRRLHTLSAGQRMRLGFAISTAIQPDILLMDEWIGAGDENFIERARARMLDRFHGSRIVVLASHNSSMLREMCNKALVLDSGRMRFFGGIDEGREVYREIVSRANAELRKQAVQSDPLLFGDILGLVERIAVESERLEVEGWAVLENGREVQGFTVEFFGECSKVEAFERVDRDDVRRHLAKSRGAFGFRFSIPLRAELRKTRSISDVTISVAGTALEPRSPLRMAAGAIVEGFQSHAA